MTKSEVSERADVNEFNCGMKDIDQSLDQQQLESADTDLINMSIDQFDDEDDISLGSIGPHNQNQKISPPQVANNTDKKLSEDTMQSDDEDEDSCSDAQLFPQSSDKK